MKFDIKSLVAGIIIGTVGITAVFASGTIKSAEYSEAGVSVNGVMLMPSNPLISVVTYENEEDAVIYMPMRDILEYVGIKVNWNPETAVVELEAPFQKAIMLKDGQTVQGFEYNVRLSDKDVEHIISLELSFHVANENEANLLNDNKDIIDKAITEYLESVSYEYVTSTNMLKVMKQEIADKLNIAFDGKYTFDPDLIYLNDVYYK